MGLGGTGVNHTLRPADVPVDGVVDEARGLGVADDWPGVGAADALPAGFLA